MVLGDFLSDTRRRWKKALKLFKRSQQRRSLTSPRHNRVSPERRAVGAPGGGGGTVDAGDDIAVERFCRCTPPFPHSPDSTYENMSYSDSAYDTERSSPASERSGHRRGLSYATVAYYVQDARGSDSSSVTTELTWLEVEVEAAGGVREDAQNVANEKIELLTSL